MFLTKTFNWIRQRKEQSLDALMCLVFALSVLICAGQIIAMLHFSG